MGSSGSGSLTDYSDYKGNKQGGDSGNDKCMAAFSTLLDEVGRSRYVTSLNAVPPAGTKVIVQFNVRLQVLTDKGIDIGYLPTKYNYLAGCIENGYSYTGEVLSSSMNPLATIQVDIEPHEPK